jgi:hypothetical protein
VIASGITSTNRPSVCRKYPWSWYASAAGEEMEVTAGADTPDASTAYRWHARAGLDRRAPSVRP